MARLLQLLRDYARRRVVVRRAPGRRAAPPRDAGRLQVEYEAALALTFDCARLLGRQASTASPRDAERAALRLLTPLAKLFTAKQAVALASEALEGFGGAGLRRGHRPAASTCATRRCCRSGRAPPTCSAWTCGERSRATACWSRGSRTRARAWTALSRRRAGARGDGRAAGTWRRGRSAGARTMPPREAGARRFALRLAALAAAVPLCEQAAWSLAHGHGERSALAAARWVRERIPPITSRAGSGCAKVWC